MFNIGTGELVLILVLALIVLGPDKLPNAARQAGRYLAEFRRMTSGFQQEFRDAVDSALGDTPDGFGRGSFSLPDLPTLDELTRPTNAAGRSDRPALPALASDADPAPPVDLRKPAAPPGAGDVSVDGPESSFG